MLSRRQLRLFTVFTLFFAVAQASWFNFQLFGRQNDDNAVSATPTGDARQSGSQSGSTSASVSSTPSISSTPSSTPSSSPPPSTTPPTSTPSSSPSSSPSSTPPPTSSSSSSSSSISSTPSSTPSTSSPVSKTSQSSSRTSLSEFTSSSSSVVIYTTVKTVSGSLVTSTGSSTSVSVSKGTSTAVLAADGSNNDKSSLSTKNKNTIIGVVVGVGGAAILAGLFVVAWRIWGRKKSNDEDDGLMGFRTGSAGHEKTSSVSGAAPNPFQSTLENYHNPARGNVNASSNF